MRRRRAAQRYRWTLDEQTPPTMVAAATERRLAGDWAGACAAALVDVRVDLGDVASRYGSAHAARIGSDLRGLAPDLMRRFLPRRETRLTPYATVVLSRSDEVCRRALDGSPEPGPMLIVVLPRTWAVTRQSVTLEVRHELPTVFYDLPEWAWYAGAVEQRRWAYGAGDRLPWHSADGTPYPRGWRAPPGPAPDRPGEVERLDGLLATKQTVAAFEAAGFTVENRAPRHPWDTDVTRLLPGFGRMLGVAHAEHRRLTARYGQDRFDTAYPLEIAGGVIRLRDDSTRRAGPRVLALPAPADAALLRHGDLQPDDLHPLVHEALFPGRTQHRRVPAVAGPELVRVRCGGGWHTVVATGARLDTPDHDRAAIWRELGSREPLTGCARAVRAWRTGTRPIPQALRRDRRRLFALALNGDTAGVLARLAAGIDPELRGPGGGTLLHEVTWLDPARVVPPLLAAGVPLNERDDEGRTALHVAAEAAAADTMAVLVAAGADPGLADSQGRTADQVLVQARATGGGYASAR